MNHYLFQGPPFPPSKNVISKSIKTTYHRSRLKEREDDRMPWPHFSPSSFFSLPIQRPRDSRMKICLRHNYLRFSFFQKKKQQPTKTIMSSTKCESKVYLLSFIACLVDLVKVGVIRGGFAQQILKVSLITGQSLDLSNKRKKETLKTCSYFFLRRAKIADT